MPHFEAQGLSHPKMLEPAALAAELSRRRSLSGGRQGDGATLRVVFTNGCYDILHPGHVDLLSRARMLGHVLVLALNTDQSVRRLGKGEDRPLNPLVQRAFVAAHLQSVDYVTFFDEDTPLELIALLRPDVLVKGGDWPLERIVGREVVESGGGTVVSLPLLPGYSTTALVTRIRNGCV